MNSTTASSLPGTLTPIESCQQDYQYWQALILQQEEEIGQLLALLLDVMDRYNYQSLRQYAVDYYCDLNQLQTRLNGLNRDGICQGTNCSTSSKKTCTDARFGLSDTLERRAAYLLNEFSRIKTGCHQFLSGLVSLNLL